MGCCVSVRNSVAPLPAANREGSKHLSPDRAGCVHFLPEMTWWEKRGFWAGVFQLGAGGDIVSILLGASWPTTASCARSSFRGLELRPAWRSPSDLPTPAGNRVRRGREGSSWAGTGAQVRCTIGSRAWCPRSHAQGRLPGGRRWRLAASWPTCSGVRLSMSLPLWHLPGLGGAEWRALTNSREKAKRKEGRVMTQSRPLVAPAPASPPCVSCVMVRGHQPEGDGLPGTPERPEDTLEGPRAGGADATSRHQARPRP